MTGFLHSLVRLLMQIVVALALALPLGLLLALLRSGGDLRRDLGVACLLVGCVFLLLAPAGHSPSMRAGTIGKWTASFFPRLVPGMSREYGGTTLSNSVVLGVTGIALILLGVVAVG